MARLHSPIEVVDLTEEEGNVRYSRSALDPAIASIAATLRQSPKKSASHVDVKPVDLDPPNGSKSSQSSAKTASESVTSSNAVEISRTSAYAFLDHPTLERPEIATSKPQEAIARTQQSVEEGGKKTQTARPPPIEPASKATSKLSIDGRNRQGLEFLISRSPSTIQRNSANSDPPPHLETKTRAPPTKRAEPPAVMPQKRKQSSPSPSSKQPVFRTPPKIVWQENGIPRLAQSPVLQSPLKAAEPPTSIQSPKDTSQSPTTVIFPDGNSTKPPTTVSRSPPRTSGSSSNSAIRSPSRTTYLNGSATASNSAAPEVSAPATPINGQLANPRGEGSMESVSPKTSSFPPDFDRGRFPYQRRRRGARGAPNPWVSKGHHKKTSLNFAPSVKTPSTYINQASQIVNASKPLSWTPSIVEPSHKDKEPPERSSTENPGTQPNGHISYELPYADIVQMPASDSRYDGRPGLEAATTEQSQQRDHLQSPHGRRSCVHCTLKHSKCDQIRPSCGLCAALKVECYYVNSEQTQSRFRPSTSNVPSIERPLEATNSRSQSISQMTEQGQTSLGTTSPVSANGHSRSQQKPTLSNEGTTRNVHVKKDEGDQNDPDSIPDYLGSPRAHGWHHDGYADVRVLFKRVAFDTVRKENGHYKDWPVDLELITQKVTEKAEEWASKKFGYFVKRLNVTPTSVPNVNDVKWIQRKVMQTFFEEANRAQNNRTGQSSPLEVAQAENPAVLSGSNLSGELRVETEASGEEISRGRGLRRLGPKSATSKSIPSATSSPLIGAIDAPFRSHQQINNPRSNSRPSRAAAGTAISRITSQYGTLARSPGSGVDAPGTTFDRQLCTDCDCWISSHNFRIHLGSLKHKKNAKEAEAKQEEAARKGARLISRQTAAPNSKVEPEQRRLPPRDRGFATPSTTTLQPQRKSIQGIFQTSLAASFAIGDSRPFRPYQEKKRGAIENIQHLNLLDQDHVLQHVDFTADEIATIKGITVKNGNGAVDISESLANAYADSDSILMGRDKQATRGQIQNLDNSGQKTMPMFIMTESRVKDPNLRTARQMGSLLRHRELGSSATGRHVETRSELKIRVAEAIRPWRSFTGASHDVVALAWAPNSMEFAAGAVAHSNPEDLQYNRPCNLLLGNLRKNTLTELPDHRIDRRKLEVGPNSTQDMFNACDPKVYKTVTSVKFHPQGDQMYTASEDQTAKIWDLSKPSPECKRTLRHDASVTSLDISPLHPGVFATASQKIKNAIRVFRYVEGQESLTTFSSSRAEMKPEWKLYPEGLYWGPSVNTSHLLLGGFQEYGREVDSANEGHLCLWDVTTAQDLKLMPAAQAIHTAAWHPSLPYFASGGAPGFERTDRQNTKTVVRAWDLRHTKRLAFEYECPAQEMTDVTFSPLDYNIVTAGCTNSISYVWDWRWPQHPVHQLHHGKSVMPTGERDTGVMMSLWGTGSSLYYTGSSDGSIRAWDIRRHPNDVLVRTVAQLDAGIQSGAFSPDGTHLLVGDATGGIQMLSSAPWEPRPSESTADDIRTKGTLMDITRAPDGSGRIKGDDDNPGTKGIMAGMQLLSTDRIALDPVYGPGKGTRYDGPYAMYAREQKLGSDIGRLRKDIYKQQPFSRTGELRPDYADPIRILAAVRKELLDQNHQDDLQFIKVTPKAPDALDGPRCTAKESADLTPNTKIGINEAKMLSTSGAAQALNNLGSRGSDKDVAAIVTPKKLRLGPIYHNLSRPTTSPQQDNPITPHLEIVGGGGASRSLTNDSSVNSPVPKPNAKSSDPAPMGPAKHFAVRSQPPSIGIGVIDNLIPESEMVEENGWWPQLGEEEIAKARARPRVKMG